MQPVNQSTRRSLRQDSGDSADGQGKPNVLLVPSVSRQVNGEKRSDSCLNVGEKEIQAIQAV